MDVDTRRRLGHLIPIVTFFLALLAWLGIWLFSVDLSIADKQMAALNLLAFTLASAVTLLIFELGRGESIIAWKRG
ncbi:TPA: hypothetical protein HA251_07840 [Candidatus Woesearchaeota archaeon]|nr:hypothetical protein [Candidatus Woesearchaeota archaeon]